MLPDTNIIFVFIVRMLHTPRVEVFLKVITYISVAQFTFDKKNVCLSVMDSTMQKWKTQRPCKKNDANHYQIFNNCEKFLKNFQFDFRTYMVHENERILIVFFFHTVLTIFKYSYGKQARPLHYETPSLFVSLLQISFYQFAFYHWCFIIQWCLFAKNSFITFRPRQNGRHFADAIFLNENAWIALKISLKFVSKVRINNIPALVQIMAWHRPGDKSLSEPMMVSLLAHICVTRPQWVKHDDAMTWKFFPHYWPIVRQIYQPPVALFTKGNSYGTLIFFSCKPEQSNYQLFVTPWCFCDVSVMNHLYLILHTKCYSQLVMINLNLVLTFRTGTAHLHYIETKVDIQRW